MSCCCEVPAGLRVDTLTIVRRFTASGRAIRRQALALRIAAWISRTGRADLEDACARSLRDFEKAPRCCSCHVHGIYADREGHIMHLFNAAFRCATG